MSTDNDNDGGAANDDSSASDANGNSGDSGDDKKPQGLSTNEMLWILLAIAAVLLISRGVQHLF